MSTHKRKATYLRFLVRIDDIEEYKLKFGTKEYIPMTVLVT